MNIKQTTIWTWIKSCCQIKWEDTDEDEVFNEEFDQEENTEENEKPKRKAAVKPKGNKKLNAAVAREKNNSSLLSFFQKPQKRNITTVNSADVTSTFLTSRKLKFCTSF